MAISLWQGRNDTIYPVRFGTSHTGATNGNSCLNLPKIGDVGCNGSLNPENGMVLNMVRAGAVNHPSEWVFGGYNEIQRPKKKNVLINYDRLTHLLGFDNYEDVRINHSKWVESCLRSQSNGRDEKWTRSIAIGSRTFIDDIKERMGIAAKGRKPIESGDSFQLRESVVPYNAHLRAKNSDIGDENTYLWE